MKKVLFPVILIATLVGGGLVAFAIWRASPMSSQDYLDSGKKYFEAQKYSESTIQFLNAVKKDDHSRDARYFLALSYLRQGDFNSGAKQLKALLEYFQDDVEANLQMGNLYLASGSADSQNLREANQIAQKILAKDPKNIAALILSGNALAGLRDYTASLETFEKVITLDPQNTAAFISMGTTQVLGKKLPEAEQSFLKARAIDPKNKSALVSLANYYRAAGELGKSEATFKEAAALYPSDPSIYTQIVQLYYQAGRFDDAINFLKDTQKNNPKDPQPSFVLADMYIARNQGDEAKKLLLAAKPTFPEDVNLAVRLAVILMHDDKQRAKQEIDFVLKAQPTSPMGQLLLGELQYTSGDYEAAAVTFGREILVNSRFPEAQFFLGSLAIRKGDLDKAQEYFQRSIKLNPQYLPPRIGLAELHLKKGHPDQARSEVQSALAIQKDNAPARLIKASIDRVEKHYAEAGAELTALAKEQPGNAEIQRQIALYHMAQGRTGDAEKSLEKALELQPDSKETLTALVQVYVQGKKIDKALARINSVPDAKKEAFHYELLGGVYAQSGKIQEAEAAYKQALAKDPSRSSPNALLAAQYIQTGRTKEGLTELDALIKKVPTSVTAYGTKGMLYESEGKVAEAKESYGQALKINPNYEPAANNLAYLLAEEGRDLQTALSLSQNARKRQPQSPNIADTLGWIYYKLGNNVLAREQVQFAVSKDPGNPIMQYHLGMIYKANKQFKDAQAALKKAVDSSKAFKEKPLAESALKEVASLK